MRGVGFDIRGALGFGVLIIRFEVVGVEVFLVEVFFLATMGRRACNRGAKSSSERAAVESRHASGERERRARVARSVRSATA